MNLFIYTGASRLNAAVVESATDLTPVARLPDLIVGDSEPVTVKFLSASGAYESWSGGGTYTLSISIGTLGADGIGAYFQTSSFTAVTNGWTGRLNLASGSLPSAVAGYLADRPGAQSVPLFLQVRVTDADGNSETYARQAVAISGAVSVPTTANSTPVTYATAADVAADAATASAAAIAAAASASAASGSASTAAGHVTTAGNSATAAAASAVTAGNSATTAAGSATTATTQATNAATSSSSASTYKDAAAVSAASATSSAGTATTQAALATTNGAAQVTLAAAQVTLATTQAGNAGTSATAAGVSAAAALVSEAAALVSKNAAAASAATASAVSGSGNGTFSAAALTGVTSVTAPAATALTLAGGSTGASLVLGQSATGRVSISRQLDSTVSDWFKLGTSTGYGFIFKLRDGTESEYARLTNTGNLLIGTTTDIAGSGGLHVAGTSTASTTTSGALRVGSNIGLSGNAGGASYFGGAVTAGGGLYINSFIQALGSSYMNMAGGDPYRFYNNSDSSSFTFDVGSSGGFVTSLILGARNSATGTDAITMRVRSATVAAFRSTFLDIPLSTASTLTTNGALVVTGGVGVGGAMNVGGGIGSYGASASAGSFAFTSGSMTGTNMYGFTDQTATYTVSSPATEVMGHRVYSTLALGASGTLANWYGFNSTLSSKTGAAVLTNAYAFYANSPTQATNNYAFYSAGTAPSVFGGAATFAGIIKPQQATTAGAPAYVKGAIYFDTTLNKLRVGGATAWETITSV